VQTESNIRLASAPYRIWIIRGVAVALTVGLLVMSAPLVWAAVSAGAGILVLAALAATGFVALQMIPFAMSFWFLSAGWRPIRLPSCSAQVRRIHPCDRPPSSISRQPKESIMKLAARSRSPFSALCCALAASLCLSSIAQEVQPECSARIGGGPKGKIYELMIRDMQSVCGSEVLIRAIPSIGGLPNLMMLSSNQADMGIVQLDTLQSMARGGDENISNLQVVMPLHTNLLHILSLRDGSKAGPDIEQPVRIRHGVFHRRVG